MNVIIALTRTKTTEQSAGTINIYAGKIIKIFDFVDSGSLSKVLFYDEGSNVKEVIVDEAPATISGNAENLIAVISNDSDIGTFYINTKRILDIEDNVVNPLDESGSKIRKIIYYAEGADNDELLVTDSVATITTNVGAVAIKGQGDVVTDAVDVQASDMPAGDGTAGWDNDTNKDLAVAAFADLKTDVADTKTQLNALLTSLRNANVIKT